MKDQFKTLQKLEEERVSEFLCVVKYLEWMATKRGYRLSPDIIYESLGITNYKYIALRSGNNKYTDELKKKMIEVWLGSEEQHDIATGEVEGLGPKNVKFPDERMMLLVNAYQKDKKLKEQEELIKELEDKIKKLEK